jgi:BioD-like phosphotransacetylase family protein
MRSIIVASTRPFSGKTGICLALARELEARGRSVAYFKPYGTMPYESDGVPTDRDAAFVNASLSSPGPADAICPIVRTRQFTEDLLADRPVPGPAEVRAAFARVSEGRDVVVVEGPSDVEQGKAAGVSVCEVAGLIDSIVLLVEPYEGLGLPDATLLARDCLGQRLGGIVFNQVRDADRSALLDHTRPYLEAHGVPYFGALSHDPILSSVTVREIVDELGGAVLCAEEHLDEPVESFMVGAMGQEKALRFFRRKSHKAVITGGDRADVQLAALETSTAMLILTGNLPPSPIVLSRADELGIPMILVDTDTLSAVEHMEGLMGHVRLHGPGKIDRISALFAEGVALDELLAAFRL